MIPWHLVFVLFSCSSFANEAFIEVYGGGAKLRSGESSETRMDSEVVRIELGKDSYIVDATFEFFNAGVTTTVSVGFPQFAGGYLGGRGGSKEFQAFQTWVNGVEQKAVLVPDVVTYDGKVIAKNEAEYISQPGFGPASVYNSEKWRVKQVTFPSREKTITRVRYVAPYGSSDDAIYLYGTGRSWKGNIGSARFIVKSSPNRWLHSFRFGKREGDSGQAIPYTISRLSKYECELRKDNFNPQEWESLLIWTDDFHPPWEESPGDFSPQFWEYTKTEIPDEMLHILSPGHLRLLRNTFFAIHGRRFESADLRAYFEKTFWGKPRPEFKESDLNEIEKANVRKIADYEKRNQLLLEKD